MTDLSTLAVSLILCTLTIIEPIKTTEPNNPIRAIYTFNLSRRYLITGHKPRSANFNADVIIERNSRDYLLKFFCAIDNGLPIRSRIKDAEYLSEREISRNKDTLFNFNYYLTPQTYMCAALLIRGEGEEDYLKQVGPIIIR